MKNKKVFKIIILLSVIISVLLIYYFKPIDFSQEGLRALLDNSKLAYLIFLGLWIIRLVAFIPGATLLLIGGLIFAPIEALILSLLGLILSDSLVFTLGKIKAFEGFKERIKNKYEDVYMLVEEYNSKILAMGILCPVAPTDVICYLSSYLGLSYKKFIVTFILANLPAAILYSFLGESLDNSLFFTFFIVLVLAIISVISIKKWRKLKLSLSES